MFRLHAFGDPFLVTDAGVRVSGLTRQTKRFALLIYLLCDDHHQPHRRDELVAIFWPEADARRGRNALRQALFVIRDELGQEVIRANGPHEVWADSDSIDCDAAAFGRAIRAGHLEAALALYREDFLAGFSVCDCPEFDAWVEERRVELAGQAASAARNLAHVAEGKQDLSSALHWWRRALSLRPFDEVIIRRIMALLAGSGNRGAAIAEFERFRERLYTELGLRPSWESLELADTISVKESDGIDQWIGDRRRRDSTPPPPGPTDPSDQELHWRRPWDMGAP